MSIFNPDSSETPAEIDTSEITLDALVGEGQKYKTPDELAKAYAHADAHIAQLKAKEVEREARLKVLEDLAQSNRNSGEAPKQGDAPGTPRQLTPPVEDQPKNGEAQDLSALVAKELEKQNKEKAFASNVNSVSEKLVSYYGGEREAREALARRAKELEVSPDWLMDVAGRSPAAFYSTIGIDQRSTATPASQGNVSTAAFGKDASRRNFKYYEEIRKTNPKQYYSGPVQREILAAAREQGEKFYT